MILVLLFSIGNVPLTRQYYNYYFMLYCTLHLVSSRNYYYCSYLHAEMGKQIPTKTSMIGSLPSQGVWPPRSNEGLREALTGCDVVVIPAGVPRKPGMTRDDLFHTNASIVKTLVEGCAEFCPDAVLAIISNPVNSTVPIAAEVLKKAGVYNPAKLCGVTTLDVCRANTFVGASQGWDPKDVDVTVIGGHAGITILPLFSQVAGANFSDEELEALTVRTQFGGDEVVQAKAGAGSATLSMAYAGFLFTEKVLMALRGEEGIVQCAYVESSLTDAPFFASPCRFGKNGVEEVLGFGELSPYEKAWFDKMMPDLQKQIQKGVDFANK
jgi:malate dehydrogenase